jgi:hypothetical protein
VNINIGAISQKDATPLLLIDHIISRCSSPYAYIPDIYKWQLRGSQTPPMTLEGRGRTAS